MDGPGSDGPSTVHSAGVSAPHYADRMSHVLCSSSLGHPEAIAVGHPFLRVGLPTTQTQAADT